MDQICRRTLFCLLPLALAACGDDTTGTSGGGTGSTTEATGAGSSGSGGTSSSGGATSQGSASASGGTTTGPTPDVGGGGGTGKVVRFVALGDAGEGNEAQYAVADAIEQVCAAQGCDFALYMGDNFYNDGVSSAMDMQFQDKFELPYMDLDLIFYVALGNHDYGTVSNAWEKAAWEIEYSQYSDKWFLPAEWYTFEQAHVQFFVLDTTRLMWDKDTSAQQMWLGSEIASSSAEWIIGMGHHPYISNGPHGNAGNYEGVTFPDVVSGGVVKSFFDASICGKVDVYMSGHDHSRQDPMAVCGTEFFVSGAGAKLTDFVHRDDNPVHWEDDQKEGFMWVEIADNVMTVQFYDRDGNMDFERKIVK